MSKSRLWMKAYLKAKHDKMSDQKKIALYGVKSAVLKEIVQPHSKKAAQRNLAFFQDIIHSLSLLTPTELENIFPIVKKFNGSRHEMKDYFTTRKSLEKIDINKPIGEGIVDFLRNYYNADIFRLVSRYYEAMDNVLRSMGKPTILELFAQESGTDAETAIREHINFM